MDATGLVYAFIKGALISVITVDGITRGTDPRDAGSFAGAYLSIITCAVIEHICAPLCRIAGIGGAGIAVVA